MNKALRLFLISILLFFLLGCSNGKFEFRKDSKCILGLGNIMETPFASESVYLINTSTSKVVSFTINSGDGDTHVYKLEPGEQEWIGCANKVQSGGHAKIEYSIVGERILNE